ncbi:MAG TPA: START domain-containing protein [Myxococcota bacterium]|nr:START domain-containing protein [Myxococcota bacterium]
MPRAARRSAALLFVCAALARPALAEGGWTEVFREDGVTVLEQPVPQRSLPDFRGEETLDAELYDVLAVILDIPQQTEWMWQCRVSRVLRREGEASVVYQVLDAKWPATDRDVVFRSTPSVVEPGRVLAVRFASLEDPSVPPVPSLVRMPELSGDFRLEAQDGTHTRVTYTVSANPGGPLPAMFLRETVRQSPVDTLVGLRRRLGETRGRYAAVANDWRSRGASTR